MCLCVCLCARATMCITSKRLVMICITLMIVAPHNETLEHAWGWVQVRGYLAVSGGIDVPLYLGSRSTFPSGNFGGYQGRYLRTGDSLPLGLSQPSCAGGAVLEEKLQPVMGGESLLVLGRLNTASPAVIATYS